MDRVQSIMNRLPVYFNNEVANSRMRTIIKALDDEISLYNTQSNRVDNMVGIDTTTGVDLDNKWGALLNIPRMEGEDDALYRIRMKSSVSTMGGGTAKSIQYSVAVVLKLTDPVKVANQIQVIDSWEYNGDIPIVVGNGHSLCLVDLDYGYYDYSSNVFDIVRDAIKRAKASGVDVQLVMTNYRVMTYNELSILGYIDLSNLRYNQLGGVI